MGKIGTVIRDRRCRLAGSADEKVGGRRYLRPSRLKQVARKFADFWLGRWGDHVEETWLGVERLEPRMLLNAVTSARIDPDPVGEGDHAVVVSVAAPVEPSVSATGVDTVAPRIISFSVQQGEILPTGPMFFIAMFDEDLDESHLDESSVSLVGTLSGPLAPTLFNYTPDGSTLSLGYMELTDQAYTLILRSGEGAFEDQAGNALDGDHPGLPIGPGVSGDGVAGGDFVVKFTADASAQTPIPAPLAPEDPRGSAIYHSSVSGLIGSVEDIDSYRVDLDEGQTLTVLLEADSTLAPIIGLLDPANSRIGGVSGSVGRAALLQTVETTVAGTYTLTIGGLEGATGSYRGRLILNAALEDETYGGPSNGSSDVAQLLDPGLIEFGGGRAAVLGTVIGGQDWYRFSLDDGESATLILSGENLTLDLFDRDGSTNLSTSKTTVNGERVIRLFVDRTSNGQADSYFARIMGVGGDYSLLITRNIDFDLGENKTFQSAQDVTGTKGVLGYRSTVVGSTRLGPTAPNGQPIVADKDKGAAPLAQTDRKPLPLRSLSDSANANEFIPGRLIVRFADTADQPTRANVVRTLGAHISSVLPAINGAVIELPDSKADVHQAAAQFSAMPSVLYAEPDYVIDGIEKFPDDIRFDEMWGMHNTGQSGGIEDADIDAPEAWEIFTGTSEVVIATIDTGVDYSHPDLAPNMWTNPGEIAGDGIDNDQNGYIDDIHGIDASSSDSDPMDDDGHGTHVAGILGAVGNNAMGVTGVNWNVKIMALKFLEANGTGSTSNAVKLVDYMRMMKTREENPVNIVVSNNSWGTSVRSQALEEAMAASNEAGILFVAAAGNRGKNTDIHGHYPSGSLLDGIIAVAATDANDELARTGNLGSTFSSNFGATTVDLGAPGVRILSTRLSGGYRFMNGTSMATPHVSAAAAMLMARNPEATLAEVKATILNSVDPIPALSGKTVTGGRLNLARALSAGGSSNYDFYQLSVNAGDVLVLETFTPFGGDGDPVNSLDPSLELYAPDGTQVAMALSNAEDGRNARIVYTAEDSGRYRIGIASEQGSQGGYFLSIQGSTGVRSAPSVVATTPGDGVLLSSFPYLYVVDFSQPILLTSADASDLTIDGQPALSVSAVDADSLKFEIDPVVNPGPGTFEVSMAAGAVTGLQGMPSLPLAAQIKVDSSGPIVTSTLWNGSALPPSGILDKGPLEFQALFNEALADNGIGPQVVHLMNLGSGQSIVAESVHFDPVANTLVIQFGQLTEGRYRLTLSSDDAGQGIEDLLGHDLDGEPFGASRDGTPTGNGVPGGDYVVQFQVDEPPIVPVDFERLAPLGGLIFVSRNRDEQISVPGEIDRFTFYVEAGQTISAVVTPQDPQVQLGVELNNDLSVVATTPGAPVILSSIPVTVSGDQILQVTGNRFSAFTLEIFLNAGLEHAVGDSHDGNAMAVDDAFLSLGSGRFAAVGYSQPDPQTFVEIDRFTVDLTGVAGCSIDIVLAGQDNVDFSGQSLELLDTDGTTVLAVGQSVSPLSKDLAILGFNVSVDGIYTVRLESQIVGHYGLIITDGLSIEIEPNDRLSDPMRRLDDVGMGLGFARFDEGRDDSPVAVSGAQTWDNRFAVRSNRTSTAVGHSHVDPISGWQRALASIRNPMISGIERRIVVADDPNLHGVAAGQGYDGVVELNIDQTFFCSGALLTGGLHVVTAAHCLADDFGVPVANTIRVRFALPGGDTSLTSTSYAIHPGYDGNLLNGYDVAVIELPRMAPQAADRNDLFRDGDELGQVHEKVGYGRTGTGDNGDAGNAGIKRRGNNIYEAFAEIFENDQFGERSIRPGSQLAFDFDNGRAENDAFDYFYGVSDVGLAGQEINAAPGDSGGPTFINGLVAGVASYGFGFDGAPDALPDTNASFGEFSVDTRIAFVADWIDAVVQGETNSPVDSDGDLYAIAVRAGETITAYTETLFGNPRSTPGNDLDPQLVLLDPLGLPIASDDNSQDGNNAILKYKVAEDGVYIVQVLAESGAGEYLLAVTADLDLFGPYVVDIVELAESLRNQPVSVMSVVFSELIDTESLDFTDLELTRDGEPIMLDATVQFVQDEDLGVRYQISGLDGFTAADGTYELTVDAAGITDRSTNPGRGSESTTWVMDSTGPIATLVNVLPNLHNMAVAEVDVVVSEPIDMATFDFTVLVLERNGNTIGFDETVQLVQGAEDLAYSISGLENYTSHEGEYTLTLNASGFRDAAGNAGQGSTSIRWVMDATPPLPVDLVDVVPDPRRGRVEQVQLLMSEPVIESSITHADLTLARDGIAIELDNRVQVERKSSGSTYQITGLAEFTADEGVYGLTVDATGMLDPAQNRGVGLVYDTWVTDSTSPVLISLSQVLPNLRSLPVTRVELAVTERIDRATFDFNDLSLTRDGNPVALDATVQIAAGEDSTTYWITGLGGFTADEGDYELTVRLAEVADPAGNQGVGSESMAWVTDHPAAVVEVSVGGTRWKSPFLAHLDTENKGSGGYELPVGHGAQLTPLAWSNMDQIRFRFSEQVEVQQSDLQINGAMGLDYRIAGFTYDPMTLTALWTLESVLESDRLRLSLSDRVLDGVGNALDGEWDNPVDIEDDVSGGFPSGDGATGGVFEFRINVVVGDVDQDQSVSAGDANHLRGRLGSTPGRNTYSVFSDLDADGVISVFDIAHLRNHLGTQLPADESNLARAEAAAHYERRLSHGISRWPAAWKPPVISSLRIGRPSIHDEGFNIGGRIGAPRPWEFRCHNLRGVNESSLPQPSGSFCSRVWGRGIS